MTAIPTSRICLAETCSGTKSCWPTSFGALREERSIKKPETKNRTPIMASMLVGIRANFSQKTEVRNRGRSGEHIAKHAGIWLIPIASEWSAADGAVVGPRCFSWAERGFSFAICHLQFAICNLPSAICHFGSRVSASHVRVGPPSAQDTSAFFTLHS
jgi:hypothetical protein